MQVRVQVLNNQIYLIKHRWWREVGERPPLWCDLWYVAEPRFVGDVKPHLRQLLFLERFRKLQFLHLDCPELIVARESVSLSRCLSLLHTVVAHCRMLRKLTLRIEVIGNGWRRVAPEKLEQVGTLLVKFGEVDLVVDDSTGDLMFARANNAKAIMRGILKALPAAGSRLKILTLHSVEKIVTADANQGADDELKQETRVKVLKRVWDRKDMFAIAVSGYAIDDTSGVTIQNAIQEQIDN